MPTPFPGMDPYLERRGQWEDVHTRLIVAIADALAPQVRPTYRGKVEPTLMLNQVLHDLYDRPNYDLAIDSSQLADPPLDEAAVEWAAQLISQGASEGRQ
jgi:hypothetical protein